MTKNLEEKNVETGLLVFTNSEFGNVRAVEIDGEPWFVGKDIAEALGYSNPLKAIRDHVDDEDKGVNEMDTPGGKQKMTIINESGIYSLVLSSKLPAAKKFKRWITSEVIPSIRKHGGYVLGQEEMTGEELLARALLFAQSKIEEKDRMIAGLNIKIAKDEPKVKVGEAIMHEDGSILSSDMPRILVPYGIKIGLKNLYTKLREWNFFEYTDDKKNKATQKAVDNGLAIVEEIPYAPNRFFIGSNYKNYITVKGQRWIINKFMKEQIT